MEPCGLGSRDTLRLEAALPLWGHDIDETTNPYEAGLGWVVTLVDGAEFAGRTALERIKQAGVARKLACLKALDRGVIRDGYAISQWWHAGRTVASGSHSPTLGGGHRDGIPAGELAKVGTRLDVDVRGRCWRRRS